MRNSVHAFNSLRHSVAVAAMFAVCSCGCRESAAPPAATNETAPATAANGQAAGSSTSNSVANPSGKRRQNERWTDANGVDYIGEVPLDVFYDKPLKIVLDRQNLGSAPKTNTTTTPEPTGGMGGAAPPPPTDMAAPVAADTSGSDGWDTLITADVLKNEINEVRSFMTQNLQSVGPYKRAMLMIPPKAASLAVMAGIAEVHPEGISWKDDAKYIR